MLQLARLEKTCEEGCASASFAEVPAMGESSISTSWCMQRPCSPQNVKRTGRIRVHVQLALDDVKRSEDAKYTLDEAYDRTNALDIGSKSARVHVVCRT